MSNKIRFEIPNSKDESKYIGFNFDGDNSKFFFPPKYLDEDATEQIKKIEARKIILLLKRYQKEYLLNGDNSELFQFHSMIWLIQDYIDHGYYVETERISKIGFNGRINWKKTIKNNSILFDNGNIIYKDFVRDRIIVNDSQVLTQIYKCCLRYAVERLGFVYGIEQTERSIYDIEKNKEYLLSFLNKELRNTFKDYKKLLLNHLFIIITNQNSKNKNQGFSIYSSEFEYVFEYVVNKVFGTENVKEFYNEYFYYLPDKSNEYKARKLRPDTILKDDSSKTYYIIDSKYYNYGYSNNKKDLPFASSISKQIAYNHYLRDQLEKEPKFKVKSIFILPFAKTEKKDIKYIGYAKRKQNDEDDDKIMVYLVDLKELIDEFFNKGARLQKVLLEMIKSQ